MLGPDVGMSLEVVAIARAIMWTPIVLFALLGRRGHGRGEDLAKR